MDIRVQWWHPVLWLLLAGLSAGTALAQHTFDGNLFYDNSPRWCFIDNGLAWDAYDLGAVYFAHNDTLADPMLGDPYNQTHPNWVPAWGSPALGAFDEVANFNPVPADTCFDDPCEPRWPRPVCYRGAFPPERWGWDWSAGWTYYLNDGWDYENDQPRQDIDYGKPLRILEGGQTSDLHLTADYNYLLRGRVNMVAGTLLTIDPGVVIFGDNSVNPTYLLIERGARIHAVGTPARPIIMTSNQEPGLMAPADWGGLVFNGWAVANCMRCWEGESCGSEGGAGQYCGPDDCDHSGIMRYVRVEYAGYELAPNNEINAMTFNGLGAGTDFAYLQAHRGSDDTFEWFGGKCFMHHLVATGGQDDNCDWQMGFRGGVQFLVSQTYADAGDKGIEADNNEYNPDAPCRSNPIIANCTFVGPNGPSTSQQGIHLRRGTDAQIYNCIIMGWSNCGLRVQNSQTVARGVHGDPGVFCDPTSVDPGTDAIAPGLARIYPNPVTRNAHLALRLPAGGHTRVGIYDASGRLVEQVLDHKLSAGAHELPLDLERAAAGTYFYRVEAPGGATSGRIFVIR